ncbi:Aste57867_9806 [Aphanomyces stellatus]|uniref:Aste57867_9806 protein n=1 Tax=Aphanomyces stellatus TaxID=120398 RepID=A0A485KPG7_9STRA|nr:hypothetical protein As57867_009767 [Aphanomyces stellatus]VFT86685.1 Aste57867_9806 [Aphanomyces stellatus]
MGTSSRRAFHNDTRNFGGRVAVYDELINHQMKLLSINPVNLSDQKNTRHPGIAALRTPPCTLPVTQVSRVGRKRPSTPVKPTDLSARLSRNRKCHENAALVDHRNQIKTMMHKILHYSKKQSIDNVQTKRLATAPAKYQQYNIPLKDGFGIQRQIDAPIHNEAKRRLHASQDYDDSDIHDATIGIRSVRSAPPKSPRLHANHHAKLLLTLQLYLQDRRMSVLDLFGQTECVGDGSITVSKLRSILFHLDLGWTQHDISLLVRTLDPDETQTVLPIHVDSHLKKLTHQHIGSPVMKPQPSIVLRPKSSLYGRSIQDIRKAFASPRVEPAPNLKNQ